MERFSMVAISELAEADYTFKETPDVFYEAKLLAFMRKHMYPQVVLTATVEGRLCVVEGAYMLHLLKRMGMTVAPCYDLGEMNRRDYIINRLLLTSRTVRLNYIDIARAIAEVCATEQDCNEVANATQISYEDVKKYQQLLTFDWEAFLKAPINPDQLTLFGDE